MDLSWLHHFKNNANVCYLVNIQSNTAVVPNNKDLYILGWFFEPFDDKWFLDIYYKNPCAEFVILTDLYSNDFVNLDRVNVYCLYHYSTWFNAIKQMNSCPAKKPLSKRLYKISALSSRLSEFKFFITAKLLDKDDDSTFFTWNRGFKSRNVDDFIFEYSGHTYLNKLIDKHAKTLQSSSINPQKWSNSPLENCFFGHTAYNEAIINCLNESQSLSFTPEFGLLPVPYMTEKTWKPLFAGNAVLFSSHALAKKRLEEFGFQFQYPWAQNFDSEVTDMNRYNTILNHIDWILSLDKTTLAHMCQDSVDHNIELSWSDCLDKQIYHHNQHVMQQIQEHLIS
jgi:hypothetical protein